MLYMKWNEYGQIVGVNNAIRKYFGKEVYHEPDKTVLLIDYVRLFQIDDGESELYINGKKK